MAYLNMGVNENRFYELAYEEFGKTKQDIEEYVDILREWAREQLHFPEIPTINACKNKIVYAKFSLEKAKKRLDMFYTLRGLMPEIFSVHPLSPEIIQHSKVTYCVLLPKTTAKNERIIYMQINPNYGPEVNNYQSFVIQLVNLVELTIQFDNCYNYCMIVDTAGAKFGHIAKISPVVHKKLSVILQKVYGNRVAAIYLINFHSFLENLLKTVIIPLFPEKIRGRIKVLKSPNLLFDIFGKSVLPSDIGGEEKSLEELNDLLIEKYKEHKDRFDKIQYMVTDESLRPFELKNDDILGYYGSFKQIAVD